MQPDVSRFTQHDNLVWHVEFLVPAPRQLKQIDRPWQAAILDYLEYEIAPLSDPRSRGMAPVGDKRGLWRYRVGDYRIGCDIQDEQLVIAAVLIGHRSVVYD